VQNSKSTEPPPHAPCVELTVKGVCGIAWGPVEEGWPGIVFYAPDGDANTLDATWAVRGSKAVGSGRATRLGDPHEPPIAGAYDVHYTLAGKEVGHYRLEIENEAGTRYRLRWLALGTGALELEGQGEWIESRRLLVAAWAKPRMRLHIAYTVKG